jgi:hypothetical protein
MAKKKKRNSSAPTANEFSYKGKHVRIVVSDNSGSIYVDRQKFGLERTPNRMWSSSGVFNHYVEPAALARHIVDYLYLFTAAK